MPRQLTVLLIHSHLRCECSRQTNPQHNQPLAPGACAKRPPAGCFDKLTSSAASGSSSSSPSLFWSARGSGCCRLRFLHTSGFVDRRKLHRWQEGHYRLVGIGKRLHFSSRKCGQGCQNIHAISSHALHAAVGHHICLRRLGWRCLLCTGRGVLPSACDAVGEGAVHQTASTSAECLQSLRRGAAHCPGLRHGCGCLRHGFQQETAGDASTKRFAYNFSSTCQATTRGFLPPCKLRRRWVVAVEASRNAGGTLICPLPGKGSSRLKNGSGSPIMKLRSQKAGWDRAPTRLRRGEQKVHQPNTGTQRGWTFPDGVRLHNNRLLDRRQEEPHVRGEESSARATGMGGGRTSVSDRSGKSAGGGAGMSDSDASNTWRSDRSAPSHQKCATGPATTCRWVEQAGQRVIWLICNGLASAGPRCPQGPRKAQRLAVIKIQPSSESALAVAAMGRRPSFQLICLPLQNAGQHQVSASRYMAAAKGPARAVASQGCWPAPSGIHPGPCQAACVQLHAIGLRVLYSGLHGLRGRYPPHRYPGTELGRANGQNARAAAVVQHTPQRAPGPSATPFARNPAQAHAGGWVPVPRPGLGSRRMLRVQPAVAAHARSARSRNRGDVHRLNCDWVSRTQSCSGTWATPSTWQPSKSLARSAVAAPRGPHRVGKTNHAAALPAIFGRGHAGLAKQGLLGIGLRIGVFHRDAKASSASSASLTAQCSRAIRLSNTKTSLGQASSFSKHVAAPPSDWNQPNKRNARCPPKMAGPLPEWRSHSAF